MKKIGLILSILLICFSSITFASETGGQELVNLVYPRVGAVFFFDEGLRGDEKVEEQVKTAVFKAMEKQKNITYLNDGLLSAKFQEYSFRKNITDGNGLYPYGNATLEQIVGFTKENRFHRLIVVRCYLRDVEEDESKAKPGEETKSQFSSQVEVQIDIINPARELVETDWSFIGEGKSNIAIKSYWSATSKALGKFKSEWKPEF